MFKRLNGVGVLVAAAQAHAQFVSGNRLFERLSDPDHHAGVTFGQGYVSAVADSLDTAMFCIPSQATVGQLFDVVLSA